MSEVKVNKVTPRSGTTLTIGDSGDTTNVVGTLQNNGAALVGDISSVVAGTNLSGGGTSGDVTINLADASTSAKGAASFSSDNFAASSGAVTIKDLGIATGEIQDNAITTVKILNSNVTEAKVADNAITLAKMASGTDGNIISYDTSGNPVAVATGSSGQVLTSAGAGAVPSFQAAAAGGKILQAVSNTTNTETTNASTNMVSSGLAVAITPSASSSKILILVGSNLRIAGDGGASNVAREGKIAIFRGGVSGTELQDQIVGATNISATTSSGVQTTNSISFAFLDSPNTTNATTYEIGIQGIGNGDTQAQPFNFRSSIVLLEVGA